MTTKDIIRGFIAEKLLPEPRNFNFTDTDSLIEAGIIDSFGIMALLGFVEEKFAIKVAGNDLLPENFDSIITIAAMINEITNRQPEV